MDRLPHRPMPIPSGRPDTADRDLSVRHLLSADLDFETLVDDLLALAAWMRDHGRPSEREG